MPRAELGGLVALFLGGLIAAQEPEEQGARWFRGRTPLEVYTRAPPANEEPRFEPRERWPRKARCAAPHAPVKGRAGVRLELVVRRLANKKHLPLIEIRRAV